jgi:RimJ/RimL family protein N-acetyltransferase
MELGELHQGDLDQFAKLRAHSLQTEFHAFYALEEEEAELREERYQKTVESPVDFISGIFVDEKLVGILGFKRYDHRKLHHKGFIWGVYLQPEYRGLGLMSRLFDFSIRKAFEIPGLEKIQLGVETTNAAAEKLYRSKGFKEYGREKDCMFWEGHYYDEVLMELLKSEQQVS